MSLHFTEAGTPLTAQSHIASPKPVAARAGSSPMHTRQQSPAPVLPSREISSALAAAAAASSSASSAAASSSASFSPSVSSPKGNRQALLSSRRDTLASAPTSTRVSSVTYRHPSISLPREHGSASVQDALEQSLQLLAKLTEQLRSASADAPVSASTLTRDLGSITSLLTAARTASAGADSRRGTTYSALDFQRSLQQDLKRHARATVGKEDLQVIDWIQHAYSSRNREMEDEEDDEDDDSGGGDKSKKLGSIVEHRRPIESPTAHDFRATILCLRFVRRVRSSIARRALKESPWGSITAAHLADPVQKLLADVDSWEFDLFALERLTGPKLLQILAHHIFVVRLDALAAFSVPPAAFSNFFRAIEEGYKDVPYHSHTHGADVLQNVFYFLTRPSMRSKVTSLDVFAGCIAGAIHDFQHPGTNNAFQIATAAPVALRYNDRSVLESMHASEAFLVMRRPHHDVLCGLSPAQRAEARATIISMVLATDMSSHFRNLAELKSSLEAHENNEREWSASNQNDRVMCLEAALHCADLGNPTKPLPIYLEWTERVMREFYAQGDAERERGLPISAMCDRTKPSVERSQIGFIDFIVRPVFEAYSQLNDEINDTCLFEIGKNREHFSNIIAAMPQTTPAQPAAAAAAAPAAAPAAAAK